MQSSSALAATSTANIGSNQDTGHTQPAGDQAAERKTLTFQILSSALYHDMRAGWFGLLSRALAFFNIILGSAAVAAFGAQHPQLGQIAGLAVAILGAVGLVWDFNGNSRSHTDLKRRYYALLSELEGGADDMTIRRQLPSLYADEPPIMCAVNAEAHNRAGTSLYGEDFDRVHIRRRERWSRHITAWNGSKFPPILKQKSFWTRIRSKLRS